MLDNKFKIKLIIIPMEEYTDSKIDPPDMYSSVL